MLIDRDREGVRLSLAGHRGHHIPIEALHVQPIHLRAVVVSPAQCPTHQVHVLASHDALMMRYLTRHRAMRADLSPLQHVVLGRAVLQVPHLRQIEAPQVVKRAFADIAPPEHKHLVLVHERRMVTSTLRLRACRSQLIPVILLESFAVGLHSTHIQAFSHIDRLLLLNCGRATEFTAWTAALRGLITLAHVHLQGLLSAQSWAVARRILIHF